MHIELKSDIQFILFLLLCEHIAVLRCIQLYVCVVLTFSIFFSLTFLCREFDSVFDLEKCCNKVYNLFDFHCIECIKRIFAKELISGVRTHTHKHENSAFLFDSK